MRLTPVIVLSKQVCKITCWNIPMVNVIGMNNESRKFWALKKPKTRLVSGQTVKWCHRQPCWFLNYRWRNLSISITAFSMTAAGAAPLFFECVHFHLIYFKFRRASLPCPVCLFFFIWSTRTTILPSSGTLKNILIPQTQTQRAESRGPVCILARAHCGIPHPSHPELNSSVTKASGQ